MSSRATHWALQQMTELPVDKLILIALADFADENHQCFPSRKKLAIIGMCSVDTVDRALGRLIEAGFVSKSERHSDRGGLTSNSYTLHVETPSRNLRLPQPQIAATLAAPDAATLAAQDAATGTINLTVNLKEPPKPPKGGGAALDLKSRRSRRRDRLAEWSEALDRWEAMP